ncbi:Peptidase M14, carboxypeptidase A [Phytophthora cactorum]|nr:Peptidase M14, carboxypeptidase A [Phytophthora cactorum]
MSSVNPRANRFRKVASQSILVPPPLPLINLPEEPRLVRTGVPDERPMYLPVRRLLPNAVAIAALKSSKSVDFNALQPPKPEPILQESRALLDVEAEAYEERDVLSRLHVYEYNQPKVFRDCNAPDDTLVFDSLFEGGNLLRAERIFRKIPSTAGSQQEYDLLIHPDVKNGAYRQWFYFEIRNGKPGITYRFALVNLAKSGALFGQGLQPVVYSEQDAAQGLGWRHRGSHVRYDVAVSPMAPPGANALTFQYEFEHENDCVYFACIQPYTYTGKDGLPPDERRISARVHPGEPNSSWMMQGMLDYLTGSSSGATVLRRNFVFKVAPMLNPDGVINGNTRHQPEHLHVRLLHAKKKTDGSKSSGDTTSSAFKSDPRVFPMIVARHARHFSFADCDFSVHKSKMTTARVVVNQELGVTNSYTLEASFCGPDFGARKGTQFSTWDLEEMGPSGVDVNDRDDDNEMDSDLSGAEEEPIPPSPEQQITPQVESEPKKPQDEVEATEDSHKQSRGIKLKAVVGQAMKKADKAKKKKKRKGKPELKRTYSTTTPPMRSKPEDAPRMSPELAELLTPDVDTNPKPLTKRTTSAARKSMSARPKRSSETPKSVSSAILQATKNVDLRPSSRLGSIPTYPNTPMLVLPSVVDSSRVITRALRTAPAHDQDFSGVIEEKTQSRIRSELPALQLSGRDEDQRRQSLRRKSRRQENDMKSDDSDALPIPESYGSSKLLNLVT